MAGGVVVFDYNVWSVRYPELAASVAPDLAQMYFAEATLYCDNTPRSVIQDLPQRSLLLNMVTAHVAALNNPITGQLIGRITNATQGSVSVTAQLDIPAGSAQWYAQTKYGLSYWQATAQYRSMRYVPAYVPPANPFG